MVQPVEVLSPQQLLVLRLAWEGFSVKETAEVLGLSWKTVKNYRSHIYQKFEVRNVEGMLRQGVELGLLDGALRWSRVVQAEWPGCVESRGGL